MIPTVKLIEAQEIPLCGLIPMIPHVIKGFSSIRR